MLLFMFFRLREKKFLFSFDDYGLNGINDISEIVLFRIQVDSRLYGGFEYLFIPIYMHSINCLYGNQPSHGFVEKLPSTYTST